MDRTLDIPATANKRNQMKHLLLTTIAAVLLVGCGSKMDEAQKANTAEELASALSVDELDLRKR